MVARDKAGSMAGGLSASMSTRCGYQERLMSVLVCFIRCLGSEMSLMVVLDWMTALGPPRPLK